MRLIKLLFFLLLANYSFAQQYCTLTGTVADMPTGALYVNKVGGITLDRKVIRFKDGKFHYLLKVDQAEPYSVYFKDDADDDAAWTAIRFVASPNTKVKFSLIRKDVTQSIVEGDANTASLKKYEKSNKQFWDEQSTKRQLITSLEKDSSKLAKKLLEFDKASNELYADHVRAFVQNDSTIIAPYALYELFTKTEDIDPALKPSNLATPLSDSLYRKFCNYYPSLKFTKGIGSYLKGSKLIALGSTFVDFTLPNQNNKPIAFSGISKGKIVLLDFWASWCGPCRKKYKELIPVYNKYKEHGFEVVCISIDSDKTRWLKAIKEDKVKWISLIDLNSENNIADLYKAYTVPTNYLIDSTGKVIAKNVDAKELATLIEKISKSSSLSN